jgi:asparagine synthase (glutamine-hydrolysing)
MRKLSDILASARDPHELAALQRRVFSDASSRAMLSPEVLLSINASAPFHGQLEAMRRDVVETDLFSIVSAWELRTYMADVLLRDSDVMSMRHSLELRVPFVDRPLVEWIWRQPAGLKEDRRRPKSALLQATLDILPPGLVKRRKRGFTLPFSIWMRKELRPFLEEVFSSASIERSGLFSAGSIQMLWRNFVSGGDNREWSRVWSLAVLIAFVNRKPTGAPIPGLSVR